MNDSNAKEILELLVGSQGVGSQFPDVGIEIARMLIAGGNAQSRGHTISNIRVAFENVAAGVRGALAIYKATKAIHLAHPQEHLAINQNALSITETDIRSNPHLSVGYALCLLDLTVRSSNAGSPEEHYMDYLAKFLVSTVRRTHSVEMDKDSMGFLGNLVGKSNSMALLKLCEKLLAAFDSDVISALTLDGGIREDNKDGLVQIIDRVVTKAFLSLQLSQRMSLAGGAGKVA